MNIEVIACQRVRVGRSQEQLKPEQQDTLVLNLGEDIELEQRFSFGPKRKQKSNAACWASVADGVAISPGGAMASRSFLKLLHCSVLKNPLRELHAYTSSELPNLVHAAYKQWQNRFSRRTTNGASTTLASVMINHDRICAVNCGDSRIWRIRQREDGSARIMQLSQDHTVWQEMLDRGEVQASQQPASIYNALMHCLTLGDGEDVLGPDDEDLPAPSQLRLHVWEGSVLAEEIYLVATDGLHGMSENFELARLWRVEYSLERNLDALLGAWSQCGAVDDISMIAVRCYHANPLSKDF